MHEQDAPPLDLVVVGAQKAGTTSLYRLLLDCPDINGHRTLEFPYFTWREERGPTLADEVRHRFEHPTRPGQLTAVKSSGVMYLPWAPERLHRCYPEVRTVAIVREPVSRAYSAFWYLRRVGVETLERFEDALEREAERLATNTEEAYDFAYVDRGRYARQIEQLDEVFGRDRVLVVTLDALHADPQGTLDAVRTFAGLDPIELAPAASRDRENASATSRSRLVARAIRPPLAVRRRLTWIPVGVRARAKGLLQRANERPFTPPPMARATAEELLTTFREPNAALAERIGGALGWDEPQCRVAP